MATKAEGTPLGTRGGSRFGEHHKAGVHGEEGAGGAWQEVREW